jgi:tetratricopeptide (TPR) repeat protein
MKFAHFYDGRSHVFDADPSVTDFVIGFRNATQQRKAAGFLTLAQGYKITDFQKATALEQAAKLDRSASFIDQIPIEAVKKTAQMQNLLANYKANEVVKQFADEDISRWPFWKRGDGFQARGWAHSITKAGDKAEADFTAALEFTGDLRQRETILLFQAQNRENNLKDDAKALDAYQAILEGKARLGGADEYSALQGIARIQTRRGQFDEALKILNRAEPDKLQGVWKTNILKSIEDVNKSRR